MKKTNWRIFKTEETTNQWDNKEKLFNSHNDFPTLPTSNWRIPKTEPTKKPIILKNQKYKSSNIEKIEININTNNNNNKKNNTKKSIITKSSVNKNQNSLSKEEKLSKKKANKIIEKPTNQINNLTSEQIEILNEEPLNTTNPLKAILGYIPKDDQRICKFAVNGECFKSNCHFSHETKISEGWTTDKTSVIISNCNEPIHPDICTTFQFIPTHIEECGYKLYGQILSSDLKTFYNLMNEINTTDEINSFLSYPDNLIPTLAELILAKYTDGLFYRGQIIDYDENNNSVLVFFVDYGNMEIVDMTNIKKWNRKYEIVPFQAINFTLNGIKSKIDKEIEFRYFMQELLLDKICNGISIDYFDSTYIKILDNYETDIIDELLKLDFCEINNNFKFSFNKECARIPG